MIPKTEIIEWLDRHGYFNSPSVLQLGKPEKHELPRLRLKDHVVQAAIREAQDFNGILLEEHSFDLHRRSAIHDGDFGPATEQVILTPRCGEPDFYPPDSQEARAIMPAVGNGGNWPRCHGIGNYHAASISVTNSPPPHVAPHFPEIIRRVTIAEQQIGLQLYWDGVGSPIKSGKRPYNLTFTFVQTSSGWIGLAQVASNVGCSASTLFSRYLARYMSGSSAEAIIRQWCVLIMHEITHNKGSGHTRGGIMNPSILSLPASWQNDILLPWLRTRYGGVAVPTGPTPGPDPEPRDTFFRGELELYKGDESQGKFILIPKPKVI